MKIKVIVVLSAVSWTLFAVAMVWAAGWTADAAASWLLATWLLVFTIHVVRELDRYGQRLIEQQERSPR